MPKRTDLRKIAVIGAGPIIIGQACEFDYSGTQACKSLKEEGYEVVLINSNPATIMTDPGTADRTYIEPLTVDAVAAVLRKERPTTPSMPSAKEWRPTTDRTGQKPLVRTRAFRNCWSACGKSDCRSPCSRTSRIDSRKSSSTASSRRECSRMCRERSRRCR